MNSGQAGAFGEVLRKTFRLGDAPTFVARTLRKAQIAVVEIDCGIENNGLSEPLPREDAFLVVAQLRECPAHEMFFDGRPIKTGHLIPGTTCIYDLRTNPQANSISPFHHLSFYMPREALNLIVEMEGMPRIDEFDNDPGFGIADPIIHGLARCLLPAFDRPGEVSTLHIDHLTIAAATHLVQKYGVVSKRKTFAAQARLSAWQAKRVQEMMREHLDGAFTLNDLASLCNLPPLAFARAFRNAFGMPPHRWLAHMRLEKAQALLLGGSSRTLAEIAAECGFESVRHLTRALRRADARGIVR